MQFNKIELGTEYAAQVEGRPEIAYVRVLAKRQTVQPRSASQREIQIIGFRRDGTEVADYSKTWQDDGILGNGITWLKHQEAVEREEQELKSRIEEATRYNAAIRAVATLLNDAGLEATIREGGFGLRPQDKVYLRFDPVNYDGTADGAERFLALIQKAVE